MSKLKELRDRRAAIARDGEHVVAAYTGEDRDPTAEEMARLEALAGERDQVNDQIDAIEARQELERGFAPVKDAITITGGAPRIEEDPLRGFKHIGEYCLAVRAASRAGGVSDDRLFIGAAPTSYGQETVGADGGFAVPPGFSAEIMSDSLEQDALLPLTDSDPVSGNGMSFPSGETTPWGTTGVRAYWESEAEQATQTKPVLGLKTLRLKKLFALVPMTEELLADSATIGGYVQRKAAESVRYKTNDAIVNGLGGATPLGIMNASSTVSQAKEGSQAAATINANNISKMYGRVIGPQQAVWLVNPDAVNQLIVMTIGDQPVWTAPNQGMADAPIGRLMGRPIILTDTCATLGTVGDIIFANLAGGYKTITKSGGMRADTSMHLWFDYDVQAFRLTFRVDGQPWLDTAYSPAKGSVTRSHFCTLATRA
jgi:HK97 family phage major capsid protein